jgi:3-hydroxyisobutyrate dehydrogenase-like beta-hydroxyacid dehydrogenase
MQIGFIGAGAIGAPVVRNFLKAGYAVAVHNRRESTAAPLVEAGATWAPDMRAVVAGASFVFSALPGPDEQLDVYGGEAGLIASCAPGTILLDMTTSSPRVVRELAAAFEAKGCDMLDTPVSGGPKGAANRKLAIWVGGREEAFARAGPILDVIGDQVRYLGPSGTATVAKLAHNCANYGFQAVLAEVMTLGVRGGVDPAVLFGAIRQGSLGRQRAVDRLADQFLPGEFDKPTFALKLAQKDVRLATELGRELDVPMRIASMTYADLTEAVNRGWGARDSRAAMILQQERSNVSIKVSREVLDDILKNEPL